MEEKIDDITKDRDIKLRTISVIAREIKGGYWQKPYFGAVPYIDAMLQLESIDDMYGCDTAESIVLYFLSNATTWKGEKAREIKKELKDLTINRKKR